MTSLRENFETSVLSGYRTVTGGYASEHVDIRSMNQDGRIGKIPIHFLARFTMDELKDSIEPDASPVGELGVNVRRPGDNWDCVLSPGDNVVSRSKPGLKPDLGFVCDFTGTNDFISYILRPVFALPSEPEDYAISLSGYTTSDIFYLVLPDIPPQVSLASSWVMISDVANATTSSAWKMAPLGGVGVTQSDSLISFPLSAFSSLPSEIASVRLSFACSDGSTLPTVYVSEIGIRKTSTTWRPMDIDTRHDALVRTGASSTGEVVGTIPSSQPQMIWANADDSRIEVLGGITVAEFNSGDLPALETSAIKFLGDVDIRPDDDTDIHEISSNFSISCWARLNADSLVANRPMGLVAKWERTYDAETDTYGVEHGSYRFGITPSGELRFQLASSTYTSSGAGIAIDTWYHLAVTRNGTALKMYVNGEEVSSHTVSSSVTTDATAPFSLAAWSSY
jgi:hypothetical protein